MENKSLSADTRNRIRAIEQICTESLKGAKQTIYNINHLRILDNTPVTHLVVQRKNILNSEIELENLAVEYIELTGQRIAPSHYEDYKSCTEKIVSLIDSAIEKQEDKNLAKIGAGEFEYLRETFSQQDLIDVLFKPN